ncbi:aldose 1-epimerase family protein [Carnobacterium funditum]|uniref:aldose 1-epimerase family protein n=1 Tax=Carnobacterium funditum TaxID=2752 RepID=UPI00055964F0|nr:aldose 1-epimerase family protein [Carnobacterium funditum]
MKRELVTVIKLENHYITVTINEKGAEQTSLKNKQTGVEYIWQGEASVWGRHAPVLFPFVGRLKDNQYQYEDKTYSMPQHGFARDRVFDVTKQSETEVTLSLFSDKESKDVYPFDFRLSITYQLNEQSVNVSYQVENVNQNQPMYFSIGGHPGFNVPLTEDTTFEDYYLSFSPKRSRTIIPLKGAYIDFENRTLGQTNTDIALRWTLFDDDALIYETKNKNIFSILSDKTKRGISFRFEGFPYVGIWSPAKLKAPLVCIEPWYGIADTADASGLLEEKLGIQQLKAGEVFDCDYTITIH